MPIRTNRGETLTPRELAELDWDKEQLNKQIAYNERVNEAQVEVKRLETQGVIEAKKAELELRRLGIERAQQVKELEVEIKRLEVKWMALLRIPLNIVLLPVKLIMALAIPISVITGKELGNKYWEFMK